MNVIRLADRPEVPWANGRGLTRQLLRDGAEPAPWNWRLSVATVSEPGAFSSLPGIDRILVCIGDVALPLTIDGNARHAQPGHPISFPGEAAVVSLGTVATRDVNVMVRRDTAHALVEVLGAGRFVRADDEAELTAFVALSDGTAIGGHRLAMGDTLVIDRADHRKIQVARGSGLHVAIRLH